MDSVDSSTFQTKKPVKKVPFNSSTTRNDIMVREAVYTEQLPSRPERLPTKLHPVKPPKPTSIGESQQISPDHKPIIQLLAEERAALNSPGPGSYSVDIQEKVKQLGDQFARRYRANPFGSSKKRFTY